MRKAWVLLTYARSPLAKRAGAKPPPPPTTATRGKFKILRLPPCSCTSTILVGLGINAWYFDPFNEHSRFLIANSASLYWNTRLPFFITPVTLPASH